GTPPSIFTVTNLGDSGVGSLRQRIAAANATAPGPNFVNFAPGLNGTIVLTSGAIFIGRSVEIDGPGSSVITIDGNASDRIFVVGSAPCPTPVGSDFAVAISDLRLTNASANFANSYGGAILSGRTLILDSVVIDNSVARSGGAVGFTIQYPGQALIIFDSQFN